MPVVCNIKSILVHFEVLLVSGGNQSTASSESTAAQNKEVPGAGGGGGVGGGGGGGSENIQATGRGHLLRRSTRSKTTTGSCASSR